MASAMHTTPGTLSGKHTASGRATPSNTVIISSLPRIFFHPALQLALRAHFHSYGPIRTWSILPNLARILVVYSEPTPAVLARAEMDHFVFEESEIKQLFQSLLDPASPLDHHTTTQLFSDLKRTVIRVCFGPTAMIAPPKPAAPTSEPEGADGGAPGEQASGRDPSERLKPPSLEKNFLISPPGSPPVGWTQITEDAPNQKDLADDLCQRLRFLSVGDEADDHQAPPHEAALQEGEKGEDRKVSPRPPSLKEIIILPAQPARHLPALKVQPIHASRPSPGMGIHLVKATIESMLASAGHKIAPTPRPEVF